MAGNMEKNTQETLKATSSQQLHPATTPMQQEADQPIPIPSAATPDVVETTNPSIVGGQNPTTSSSVTPDVMTREEVEQLLKRVCPDLDPFKTLDSLMASRATSNPTPLAPSQQSNQPLREVIIPADIEEGGDEWFDAVAGVEAPLDEKGEEEVYSGATVALSDEEAGAATAEMEVDKP